MMNVPQTISDITNLIINESAKVGKPLTAQNFNVIHQAAGTKPLKLPAGKMAVYTFFYTANNQCLKVGQANLNSNARYQSHHYFRDSGPSTLTNSLINDPGMTMVDSTNWHGWVQANCERFDVLIDASFGKITLNFLEGLLQYYFQPKYEG